MIVFNISQEFLDNFFSAEPIRLHNLVKKEVMQVLSITF